MVAHVTSPLATWTCLFLLLAMHLAMNYAAVRAVRLVTLNRQRANLVFSRLMQDDTMLTPAEVSHQERIFESDGLLRWQGSSSSSSSSSSSLGWAQMGVSLSLFLANLSAVVAAAPASSGHKSSGAASTRDQLLGEVIRVHEHEQFLVWYDRDRRFATVVLKAAATPRDQLKAWAVVLLVARNCCSDAAGASSAALSFSSSVFPAGDRPNATRAVVNEDAVRLTRSALEQVNNRWEQWTERLERVGFRVDVGNLETTVGHRVRFLDRLDAS